jgi:hypothetical protein
MPWSRSTTVLLLGIALLGCSDPAEPVAGEKPTIPTTEAECVAQGGSWRALGLPMPNKPKSCDLKAADAGKSCSDSSQCQGACLAPADATAGAATTGSCSAYLANFGNVVLVTDGKVERVNVE